MVMMASVLDPAPWLIDERDSFMSRLHGEFTATNGIVDLLLAHLCAVDDPVEYDAIATAV
jgi:hypothetical protein